MPRLCAVVFLLMLFVHQQRNLVFEFFDGYDFAHASLDVDDHIVVVVDFYALLLHSLGEVVGVYALWVFEQVLEAFHLFLAVVDGPLEELYLVAPVLVDILHELLGPLLLDGDPVFFDVLPDLLEAGLPLPDPGLCDHPLLGVDGPLVQVHEVGQVPHQAPPVILDLPNEGILHQIEALHIDEGTDHGLVALELVVGEVDVRQGGAALLQMAH